VKIFNIAYIEISEKKLVKIFFLVTLIKNVFGEPYRIRTDDTSLKSKLHNKELTVNGNF